MVMGGEAEVQTRLCYNKGCAKKYFNPLENSEEDCEYHSGAPVFHEGYKSWSCCEKRTTDFTEFLNIRGCCKGTHNPDKPEELVKPADRQAGIAPDDIKPPERLCRPSEEQPLVPLPSTVSNSLRKLLNKLTVNDNQDAEAVAETSVCQRKGCGKGRVDLSLPCLYHPGCPIFHEGLKYWTCCKKRTTEFDDFLNQKGCETGEHLWADPSKKKVAQCRYDWHQTGDTVNFTVYAKKVNPDLCSVSCNPVKLQLELIFGDDQTFSFDKVLAGIIEPEKSKVTFAATKVEVSMRKAEFVAWPSNFVL